MRRLFDTEKNLHPLRPRQSNAIAEVRKAIREGHRRIVLQAPTGAGKTVIAAHIIAACVDRGNRPMFTVPAITLVEQALRSFEAQGIADIGIIQAQHERTDFEATVQIASVQTLIRRELPEVHLVLIDECHIQYKAFNTVLDSEAWKDKVVIGLSATPWTKGMGRRWTKLIVAATIQELIDERLLAPFDVYAPKLTPDFSKLRIKQGEFTDESSSALMGTKSIVADVVKTWIEKGTQDRTFLFAVNCAHAQKLQKEFEDHGVSCGYIDASTTDREETVFKPFRERRFKVIASVGCLTTGVDEDVRCIIDAQPTRDEKKHVQKIGRGLRFRNDGKRLLILDHAGNTIRLGMVTDIHHEKLDMRLPGEKGEAYEDDPPPPKPKKCPNCGIVMGPGAKICKFCHHKVEIEHGVDEQDGELFLLKTPPVNKRAAGLNQQDWYSGLLGIAKERGYNSKWADHRFKAKFGEYPVLLRKEPASPSIAVRSFDHSQRIKWAKGKEKANASQ